ncbi:Oligopeptide transporter 2 [Colletotrichum sidae]|uniref:Oligopeptide transporter 2 n=1 Tax=Colletotrichum sidae TaxID=1347389 RepID=A0A4R8TLL1_9PEZI|nr:Oligopeptide transporter 2 [Colletotrichum sidae]
MNRALTRPEPREEINGWTMSRYKFFYVCTGCMFLYYWLPGYLFTALATFNWMTWISPANVTLAIVTGSSLGLGLFNPVTTFDWNVATSSYAALASPFWATFTQYCGAVLGGVIILGIYYTNMYNTGYLPINSSSPFANDGTPYVVQNVVNGNKLNETLYQDYSPPFYSAGFLITVGGNYCFYPIYFLYIMGNQWKTISARWSRVVTGYLLPGNTDAFLFSQTLGSWALAGYGDNYVQDQKMAHYAKIAPRAVFRGQNFILESVEGLCTPDQPSRFTCANDGAPLFTQSLMWGLLGSERVFVAFYPILKWCFLIGALIAVVFLVGQGYGPRYLPGVREGLRARLRPRAFALLDRSLCPLVASLLWLNPVLVVQGVQHWAPSNLSYKTPGVALGFVFMYWLPRHRLAWWEKYNYVLSAALTAGVAVSALVMFFAVGYDPVALSWWGNTVSRAGVDGRQVGVLPVPERGYFGPEKGSF